MSAVRAYPTGYVPLLAALATVAACKNPEPAPTPVAHAVDAGGAAVAEEDAGAAEPEPAPVADAGAEVAARPDGPRFVGRYAGTSRTIDAPANLPGAPRRGAEAPMSLTLSDDGGAQVQIEIDRGGTLPFHCRFSAAPHGITASLTPGQTCDAPATGDAGTAVHITVDAGALTYRGDAVSLDLQITVRLSSPARAAVVFTELDRLTNAHHALVAPSAP